MPQSRLAEKWQEEMKADIRCNFAARAWQIARVEGWRSLWGHALYVSLTGRFGFLLTRFTSMDSVLHWLKRSIDDYDVFSFDVFDTLLRRRVDPPELIKCLVAEQISRLLAESGTDISAEQALAQRNAVEEVLRQQSISRDGDRECFLDDIIAGTLKAIAADVVLTRERIVDYEIGLEKKASQLMPGVESVLAYLRSRGKRVVAVSGTYLSSSQIATIMGYHGLLKYIDKLYISSDLGKSKGTGKLFQYVVQSENGRLLHVGDDYLLDGIIPRKFGIRTLWFRSSSEQQRKRKLRKLLASDNKMDYVNAIVTSDSKDESTLYDLGYNVLGPALTVFVHCVIEQAQKDGVEALFFMARDGYVMKKIYEILHNTIYVDRALPLGRYMCLSRFPVRSASVKELTLAEVSEVFASRARFGGIALDFGDILRSYGLEPTDFTNIAAEHGVDLHSPILDPAHDTELNVLLNSAQFQSMIKYRINESRRRLRGYLASIGFMGKGKVAVVDSNSKGITQSLLGGSFSSDKEYPLVFGYYFSLLSLEVGDKTDTKVDLSHVAGIFSDWRRSSVNGQKAFLQFGMLIELFSHPNHGITVGYKNVEGRIVPVFRKTMQESQYPLTSQGLRGILSYAKDYGMYYNLHNCKCADLLEDEKTRVVEWVAFPTKRQGQELESLFVTNEWPKESNHPIWKESKAGHILKGLLNRIVLPPFRKVYVKWRYGLI